MKNRIKIILLFLPIFISPYSWCTIPGFSYADKARCLNYFHFVGKNPRKLSYAEVLSSLGLGVGAINDMMGENKLSHNEALTNLFKYKLWVDSPQAEKVDNQARHALAHLVAGPAAFAIVDNGIDIVSDRLMQNQVVKDVTQIIPERFCIQKKKRDFIYAEVKFLFASLFGVAITSIAEGAPMDEKKMKELGVRLTCKGLTDTVEIGIVPLSDKIMGTTEESFEKDVLRVGLTWVALVGVRQIARMEHP